MDPRREAHGFRLIRSDSGIEWIRSDGSGEPQQILAARTPIPGSFSPDGRRLAYHQTNSGTGLDILTLPLDTSDPGHPKAGKPEPFLATPSDELVPMFSPDGRWIAYRSNESGTNEIYVQAFPGGGTKRQISLGGGAFPRWRRDGKEILFVARGGQLMSVTVAPGATFEASAPRSLFTARMMSDNFYDVSADGERILIDVAPAEQPAVPVTLVRNWASALPRVQ